MATTDIKYPTPIESKMEKAIQDRLFNGFKNWNGGYDGWLKWCETLYEPDAYYNIPGPHGQVRLTLQQYKDAMGQLFQHFTMELGAFVAKKIHALIDSDLFFIDTVRKYPDDHMKKIEIAKREYSKNTRPELMARVDNMDAYDTVIVAFPNWWTTMPMAVFTFLESYDFTGKTICPLITHGGSGFSNSLKDIQRLCPTARITKGLAINGDDAADVQFHAGG